MASCELLPKLYDDYVYWCDTKKKIHKGRNTLYERIRQMFGDKIQQDTIHVDGKTSKAFKGLKLKQEEQSQYQTSLK